MKNRKITHVLLVLALALPVLSFEFAHAEDDYKVDFVKSVFDKSYLQQVNYLKTLQPEKCVSDYGSLLSRPEINISVFYGYTNVQMFVLDYGIQKSLKSILQAPCSGSGDNLAVCGFHIKEQRQDGTILTKEISLPTGEKKTVNLGVFHSAVSIDNDDNIGTYKNEQLAQSQKIEENFLRALSTSQVVFYSGHSRHGGGPGFREQTPLQIYLGSWTKTSLSKMTQAISKSSQKPDYVGMFSCESDRYYKQALNKAAPDMKMILAETPVEAEEAEQALLGAINSILLFNCRSDFQDSMRSATLTFRNQMILFEPQIW